MAGADPLAGLDPAFAAKVQALLAAAKGRVSIQSGYRSVQRQQQLFDAAVKKYGSVAAARKWVAPPGHSHHNEGIAVDFGGDINLVKQLAPQFGLYQPMSWEAWHYEPMGSRNNNPQAYSTPPPGHTLPTPSMSLPPTDPNANLASAMDNFMSLVGPVDTSGF